MVEYTWEPTQWKLKTNLSRFANLVFITLTAGDYIVRYGKGALNSNLEWVNSPKSHDEALDLGVVCATLDDAKQRFVDFEMMFNIEKTMELK